MRYHSTDNIHEVNLLEKQALRESIILHTQNINLLKLIMSMWTAHV